MQGHGQRLKRSAVRKTDVVRRYRYPPGVCVVAVLNGFTIGRIARLALFNVSFQPFRTTLSNDEMAMIATAMTASTEPPASTLSSRFLSDGETAASAAPAEERAAARVTAAAGSCSSDRFSSAALWRAKSSARQARASRGEASSWRERAKQCSVARALHEAVSVRRRRVASRQLRASAPPPARNRGRGCACLRWIVRPPDAVSARAQPPTRLARISFDTRATATVRREGNAGAGRNASAGDRYETPVEARRARSGVRHAAAARQQRGSAAANARRRTCGGAARCESGDGPRGQQRGRRAKSGHHLSCPAALTGATALLNGAGDNERQSGAFRTHSILITPLRQNDAIRSAQTIGCISTLLVKSCTLRRRRKRRRENAALASRFSARTGGSTPCCPPPLYQRCAQRAAAAV